MLGGFRSRRSPLDPDYRPMYKIGLVVCILKLAARGGRGSLNKLHFFVWALKSEKNMSIVKDVVESGQSGNLVAWGGRAGSK